MNERELYEKYKSNQKEFMKRLIKALDKEEISEEVIFSYFYPSLLNGRIKNILKKHPNWKEMKNSLKQLREKELFKEKIKKEILKGFTNEEIIKRFPNENKKEILDECNNIRKELSFSEIEKEVQKGIEIAQKILKTFLPEIDEKNFPIHEYTEEVVKMIKTNKKFPNQQILKKLEELIKK